MALQSAIQGDRHTGQQITWYLADRTAKKNLTGATLSGTITDTNDGTTRAIAGVLTVTDGPNGVFTWAYGVADTATAGNYLVQFTAQFGDGLSDSSFEAGWQVVAKR